MSVKTIQYAISKNGSTGLTVTQVSVPQISQYEQVQILVQLSPEFYSGGLDTRNVVTLRMQPPSSSFNPTKVEDYELKMHLVPYPEQPGLYKLYLGGLLRNKIPAGQYNTIYINFQVIQNEGTVYSQPISTTDVIHLYKTNTDMTYEYDDLTNVFYAMGQMETKLEE